MDQTSMPQKRQKPHYAWLILIGVCFMQAGGLGAVLDAAGVFFVPICADLGFTRAEISLYLTFYFIATVVAMPFVGQWITKYNINKLLSIAFALVALAVGLMAVYNEPWQWWISGVIFGLAGSFIFVIPGPILIQNWFWKRRGIAMGVGMSFSGIGGAILSPVFAALIQSMGWRPAYVVAAVIISVMVLPWTMFVFKLKPEDKGLKPYGWTEEDEAKKAAADVAPAGPGVIANKASVLSVPFVMMFLLAGVISYFAGFNSQMSGFAQSIGYDAMTASTLLSAVMMGNVVEKLVVGWLNDKIGVQVTVFIQLILVALGLAGFIFLADKSLILLYVSAFFFGAQNSIYSVSLPLIVRQIFGERDYAKFFAWSRIGTGLIGCLGPLTIASIFDVTGSFQMTFAVGLAVCALAAIIVRIGYKTKGHLTWVEKESDEAEEQAA